MLAAGNTMLSPGTAPWEMVRIQSSSSRFCDTHPSSLQGQAISPIQIMSPTNQLWYPMYANNNNFSPKQGAVQLPPFQFQPMPTPQSAAKRSAGFEL